MVELINLFVGLLAVIATQPHFFCSPFTHSSVMQSMSHRTVCVAPVKMGTSACVSGDQCLLHE